MDIMVKLFFDLPVKAVFTVFNHFFAITVQNNHRCLSAEVLMLHQEKLLSIYDDIVCRCPFSRISFNLISLVSGVMIVPDVWICRNPVIRRG